VKHGRLIATALSAMCAIAVSAAPARAADPQVRVDLRVLVISDAAGATSAITSQLTAEGVPHTVVSLADPRRPVIDAAFLAGSSGGQPRAYYQAIVLPNENPFANPAELAAIHAYEQQFGIRQVDAYVYPSPATGQNWPYYAGPLDGAAAALTGPAITGSFSYLRGPVPFENLSTTVEETWGAVTTPLAGAQFEPLLTGAPPSGGDAGVLAGVYTNSGRSELVLNFAANPAQRQFRQLAHGIVGWVTGGTYLGHYRNYFSVHIDDVFLPDSRWSADGHCTPEENCPPPRPGQPPVTTTPIRMGPADVSALVAWQNAHGLKADLLYNGGGSDEEIELRGSDPLATSLLATKNSFRWVNHTLDHWFLGCQPDYTVIPWKCTTARDGATQYVSAADIMLQIAGNQAWAQSKGITIDPSEVVTGEHSGLKLLPQQPNDNPNLAPVLAAAGIRWIGSDNSRDPGQRPVGPALTVPRYPINIFYNAATRPEEVSEYNWIYTSRANGGSGICEDNPATTTCITPLDPATGFEQHIVPTEISNALSHVLANDPRPHYVHQSNFTDDRLAYPVLEGVLSQYRSTFADNTPLISERMSGIGSQLRRAAAWQAALAAGTASGYLQNGGIHLTAPNGLEVPVTLGSSAGFPVPPGGPIASYAGSLSGWLPAGAAARTVAAPKLTLGARLKASTGIGSTAAAPRNPAVPLVKKPAVAVRLPQPVSLGH
jgi:hypothetical protein